ncbi:undecaprenyl phosphate translocase family protein, partial [Porcipelethomonas sp.]|uniref:undecaprenyl phosphate translocase family protein n=1 Tax=Porcipelethomonas sp. TaxID=2981675 RepID=UPI003EF8400F
VNFGSLMYYLLTGMIAISAMVLPGISGSTILLIFGTYLPIMTAIKDLLHLNFEGLPIVIFAGIGIILGILLIVRLVKKALEKFRAQTIYTILGLMIGSLFAIVKGPESLDNPKDAMSFDTFSILFFIIGVVIIGGLQVIKHFAGIKKQVKEIQTEKNS